MSDPVFELAKKMHKGELNNIWVGMDQAQKIKNYLEKRNHNVKAMGLVYVYVEPEVKNPE